MPSKTKIGNNLKKARLEIGMTQVEVAESADLNANYYARVERGEETLSMKTLKTICIILKVKSSEVLDF
jgi:transcriptional regulator with XRE-family HTH domain